MKFKTQLFLGFGIIYGIFTIVNISLWDKMEYYNEKNKISVKNHQVLELSSSIQEDVIRYHKSVLELLANPPKENLIEITKNRELALQSINSKIQKLEGLEIGKQSEQILNKLTMAIKESENMYKEMDSLIVEGKEQEGNQLYWLQGRENRDRIINLSSQLQSIQNDIIQKELVESNEIYKEIWTMTNNNKILDYFIGIIILMWILFSVTRRLNNVSSVMSELNFASFDKLPRIKVKTKDEIGRIAIAYNEMAEALEEHTRREKELKAFAEEQSWLKTKVAEMANMYPSASDLETLGRLFIKKICSMVGANYGVFYLKQYNKGEDSLQKIAAYAYDRQTVGFENFRLGEGIIGECAMENKIILLNEVPEDYIKIKSGLGMATPNEIMVIPAEFQGEVLGVIELASMKTFGEIEKLLVTEVAGNLGINIKNILRHLQVEKLLKESQVLTNELLTQSEELQSQQEELRLVNEQLEFQFESSEQKTKELENVKSILEEKARQLTVSSQYKSEFLANMSHELRTPLNSMLILSQLLVENNEKNLTPTQINYAETIYTSGNDLLDLINDILDISKIEAGKMDITVKEVNLIDVKSFIEAQFQPVARQKNIEFRVELEADLPSSIITDNQRLQQILKNLLSNAFKFTEQGSIILTIGNTNKKNLSNEKVFPFSDNIIAFSVEDTGIGIPIEYQEVIFEAFKQADGKINRKYGGTGLGLSISREISQLLGGFIELDSKEGVGSTFTLYLPDLKLVTLAEAEAATALENTDSDSINELEVYPSQTEAPNKSHDKEEFLNGKTILLVDDDMRNIFALTTVLESHQVNVIFSENGREGLEAIKNNPEIDLILMDIMMPEMDGLQAIRNIRKNPSYKDLPIIALTAKAMVTDRKGCIEAGASDYISKPVDLQQLYSLLKVWLYK